MSTRRVRRRAAAPAWSTIDRRVDSVISVGDVIVALGRLRPRNARSRALIMRMLGFDLPAPRAKPLKPPGAQRRRQTSPDTAVPVAPASQPGPRERLEVARTEPPEPESRAGNALPRADAATVPAPLTPAPLFEPRWTRDIIVNALATSAPVGPYDIDALVTLLARGKTIVAIPRQPALTLMHGAHVLVDIGDSMEPFAADEEQIVAAMRRFVSDDLVTTMSFRGTPARGCGSGPLWTWHPYEASRAMVPIVLLSDLGVGGSHTSGDRADETEWMRFFASLPSDLPVLVLNPYPPSRWPAAAARRAVIIQWDRATTPRRAWIARTRHRRRA
jgi:hypothetical protein